MLLNHSARSVFAMPSPIDSIARTFECPKCGKKIKKTFAWLKTKANFTCSCGQIFDCQKVRDGILKAEKQIGNLVQKLGKLGKRR